MTSICEVFVKRKERRVKDSNLRTPQGINFLAGSRYRPTQPTRQLLKTEQMRFELIKHKQWFWRPPQLSIVDAALLSRGGEICTHSTIGISFMPCPRIELDIYMFEILDYLL